jgi:integrase
MHCLKDVFRLCKIIKAKKNDVDLTVKMLFFTGLRNQALTTVKVKHVLVDLELLQVSPPTVNSKNKPLVIPLPPKLLNDIKQHIETHQLQPEDTLLYGLNGQPLKEKQLNRITNRINKELKWGGEKRVTPHGFRSSLSTLLSDRGVDKIAIKIVLGHSDPELEFQENVWIYIRKHKRYINQIRKELTAIEAELEDFEFKPENHKKSNQQQHITEHTLKVTDENEEEGDSTYFRGNLTSFTANTSKPFHEAHRKVFRK